ncbi:hypothetical protein FSW04_10255 [Baekduia soli]|uniref:Uncharacterized protein n=1 Tax=Baekduia soli TaxID=496014 RepID=A0A5B8U4C9_9ACTN|nr:hypothetical protein [Baekduia soli]QEC47913.1 hypothetical protein FSW04_10255 [Baekduia soli]
MEDIALVARLPLSQLAGRRGPLSFGYGIERTRELKIAQGEGHTSTYIAGNETLSRVKIWEWPDQSQVWFAHRVDHASVATDRTHMPTFGKDWNARTTMFWSGNRGQVRSMTMSGRDLWLAWATGRDVCVKRVRGDLCADARQTFPQPTIEIAKIDTTYWRLRDEQFLWSGTHGYAFPALATNRDGDVGIGAVMNSSAGSPVPVVGYLTPQLALAGPLHSAWLRAGDYSSLRPGSTDSSFVCAAFTERPDPRVPPNPANTRGWHYIEYGRGSAPRAARRG